MGFFGGSNEATANLKVNYNGKKAESGLKSLKTTMKTVVSAVVIQRVASYTIELAKLGAQAELVEKNFNKFAARGGRNADVMMQKLRKASLGMVDDMALQQKAMEAMIAGVDFDDAITTMEYVSRYAIATGKDVNTKLATVFTGLARKSAMFFDDVGIQVMGSKDVVSDAVNQMKEKMSNFADSEGEAAAQAAQLTSSIQNMRVELGRELVPMLTSAIPLVKGLAEAVVGYLKSVGATAEFLGKLAGGKSISEANREMRIFFATQRASNEDLRGLEGERLGIQKDILEQQKKIALAKESTDDFGTVASTVKYEKELLGLKTQERLLTEGIGVILKKQFQMQEAEREKAVKTPPSTQLTPEQIKAAKSSEEKRIQDIKDFWDEVNRIWDEQGQIRQSIGRKQNEYLDKLIEKEQGEELESLETNLQGKEFLYSQGLATREEIFNAELALIDEREKQGLISETAAQLEREKLYARDIQAFEDAQQKKRDNFNQSMQSISTIASAFQSINDSMAQRQIDNLDKEKMSREEYADAVEKINAETAEKNKKFARMQQAVIIARAISDAIAMSIGIAKDTPGGVVSRVLAMTAGLAAGMAQVASIEAQHFQSGGLVGDRLGSNGPDDTMIHARNGEFVVNPRATAENINELRAINAGINKLGQREMGGVTLVGLTTEQVVAATATARRRRLI